MLKSMLMLALILALSVLDMRSLAAPERAQSGTSNFDAELPSVLILASYHDGDAWTGRLVRNLRYYLQTADENSRIRVHYLGARDLTSSQYLDDFALYGNGNGLRHYDRVVMLDDPALASYMSNTPRSADHAPIAIGINGAELIARARERGITLASTSSAIVSSALLARQVSGQRDLLILHSASEAGTLLNEQALELVEGTGFNTVTSKTWLSVYQDDLDYTDYAVLALDAPLVLATFETASALTEHVEAKLGPFFCHADYLLDYGCDGGAFVNIAALTDLVARRLVNGEADGQAIEVPLELSLRHEWLDQLPEGIDVAVFDAPEPSGLSRWGWGIILLLSAVLILGSLLAWWRLRAKQALINIVTHESEHDALTGLYSRRKVLSTIDELAAGGVTFSLLYLDLEGFKAVNDTFGHTYGDSLLQDFAQRLQATVGPLSTYGRLGDDRFIVLYQQMEPPSALAGLIAQALEEPFVVEGRQHTLSGSIGIALSPLHGRSASRLIRCADAAMHAVKADPEATYMLFTQKMLNDRGRHAELSSELEYALNGDTQLELHVQPIYSLQQNMIVGGEVLLRWNHPTDGYISPGVFIPTAEASDLILKLNNWVVVQTFQRMASDRLEQRVGYLSINISAKQLYTRRFAQFAIALADTYRISPQSVSFELTEHVRLRDMAAVQQQIAELREAGFVVSLDDFGAGYTSVSFLQEISFSCLKIDRSLTSGLCGDKAETSRHIMQGLLYLGERLSQRVVVEGVETQAESDILQAMGADHVQGFHYYRPMPWADFVNLVSVKSSSKK